MRIRKILSILASASIFISSIKSSHAIRCWQCAAVDGRKCPDDAKLVNSLAHDSCITWRVGNGSVLLQNLVRFSEECTTSKVNFWSRFIDLYYRGTGGSVQCCNGDGCNIGTVNSEDFLNRFTDSVSNADIINNLPAELPGAPLSSFLQQTSQLQQQQQQFANFAPTSSFAAPISTQVA